MKYEHRYFKDEEEYRESSQWKELFQSLQKLVAIGDLFVLRSPMHLIGHDYHHDNHGCGCGYQHKHCRTIPEGKPLNECNTCVGINVAYAIRTRPICVG